MRNLFLVAFGVGDAGHKAEHPYSDGYDNQNDQHRNAKFSVHCALQGSAILRCSALESRR
jgi:hypothetical protein